jgi:hypothetical protein
MLSAEDLLAQDSSNGVKAKLTISFGVEDSTKQVKAVVTKTDANSNNEPIKGVDVHFYIKKSFGLLPLEGDFTTTDSMGEASVDFPTDIPGDQFGNVTVIAKVEDNDELGNLETVKTVRWGVSVNTRQSVEPRALWASGNNAPWPLTITVTGIVVIVWGIIFYIIFQLIVIKKTGKYEIENL